VFNGPKEEKEKEATKNLLFLFLSRLFCSVQLTVNLLPFFLVLFLLFNLLYHRVTSVYWSTLDGGRYVPLTHIQHYRHFMHVYDRIINNNGHNHGVAFYHKLYFSPDKKRKTSTNDSCKQASFHLSSNCKKTQVEKKKEEKKTRQDKLF
jgi:hypothetical protein